jgi:hypothetical protein
VHGGAGNVRADDEAFAREARAGLLEALRAGT